MTRTIAVPAIYVVLALLAFAAVVLFSASRLPALALIHLALAGGVMPLIAAAMLHFAPVLTRAQAPVRLQWMLPALLLATGLLAASSFAFPSAGLRDVAAVLGILGAVALAAGIVRLSRKSLGRPHPGVHWYLAAVICLFIGLSTVLAMHVWPSQYLALRRFHLHVNTLGFIGITAIGTLQVLVPTVIGRADANAGPRLRDDLKWVLSGSLFVAAGAAWFEFLVWPGLVLWMFPVARLARAWWGLYGNEIARWHGVGTSLAGALFSFLASLLLGAGHALGFVPAGHASIAYVFMFLLPLVTGAAGYLLPLWLRPNASAAWYAPARAHLARYGALRILLFFGAGVATTWWGVRSGAYPAALGLGVFAFQLRAAWAEEVN